MKIGSLLDDERMKMKLPQVCNYCGCSDNLSLDHMIPRSAGGPDTGENLVWACRSCNSSKGTKDLLVWMKAKDKFPPILILRRYLKVAIASLDEDQLACSLADPACPDVPSRSTSNLVSGPLAACALGTLHRGLKLRPATKLWPPYQPARPYLHGFEGLRGAVGVQARSRARKVLHEHGLPRRVDPNASPNDLQHAVGAEEHDLHVDSLLHGRGHHVVEHLTGNGERAVQDPE